MKAGLVSVTFRQHTPATIVAAVSEAGLSGIEWGGDVHVPHGDLEQASEVGEMTRAAGLSVVAYGSYYRFSEVFGTSGPSFAAVLDTAAALGAPVIRLWAGEKASAMTSDAERTRLVELAREHGDQARERGVRLAFEFHQNTVTDTNESAVALLREIDHPAVTTLWQPPHGKSVEYCVAGLHELLPVLEHVHCFHWGATGSADKRPLAEGEAQWLEYLRVVASPGEIDRWVLLEFVPSGELDDFRRDAATLKGWLSLMF